MTVTLPSPPAPNLAVRAPRGRLARRDATVRALAGGVLWGVLLLVTFWWITAGGIQELSTTAGALTSLGQLTGLIASALMLAQFVLIARVPLIEKAFGQDRLLGIHRVVGFTSFSLMLAHIALITWGYAAGELSSVPGTFWQLTRDYPGMLLAVAGTTALLISVVTSFAFVRARMRYESWHLLHLYAYLGVGLALPHQLWTGESFTSSPTATAFWWTAWGLAVAAVLVWRVALPLLRNLLHQLVVSSVVPEPDGSVSVYLTGRAVRQTKSPGCASLTWISSATRSRSRGSIRASQGIAASSSSRAGRRRPCSEGSVDITQESCKSGVRCRQN